jgi:DNA polymerase-3 subunit alpha
MSGHADFVHLRTHSAYSLCEGAIPAKSLVGLAAECSMPAVALTDTNNLFGALEFSNTAKGKGVQPIVGCQVSIKFAVADPARAKAAKGTFEDGAVVLLAQTDAGYRNLMTLLKIAYMDSEDAHRPGVTGQDVAQHADGLILLTGGADGAFGRLLRSHREAEATSLLDLLQPAFGDRMYIEVQRHGMPEERQTEPRFIDWAYARGLPLVATNEPYFADPSFHDAHDALMCIKEQTVLSQSERTRVTSDHYFKTAAEMRALFADLPEAIDNTLVIARRCAFMVEKISPILPPYDCGAGLTELDELTRQSHEGLTHRLEAHVFTPDMDEDARKHAEKPYRERLDYELGVIGQMGFPGYFLIVADFIKWSKEQGIPVGPGRGSGAGSVVAWSLTITDLDPLRWDLLFERFLNPERISMPDFDIDFCQERRDEVIRYVQQKYGRDKVAQIITFGKLQARAVLRHVGRVLEMPYGFVDKICKMVPNNPANPVSLQDAINGEEKLRDLIREEPDVKQMVGIALKLEGLYHHASTHAAGVVIGDRPLEELIPLYRDPRSDMPVTGFNMKFVEDAGLVKFDFLGLKTLSVLTKAEGFVNAKRGGDDKLDLTQIPLDDPATFKMISKGDTTGVFQLESAGMRDVLRGLKPDTFEDIIAVVALYRPGPMDNIPSYVRRKHGEEEPEYLHPTLEPVLKETFGIPIYQEQVMQIAQVLSGYTLGAADLLRRAMGKKIQAEMDQQRQIFIDGAVAKGVNAKQADDIFNVVDKFAGYGFNKSHAAAYALVAYQTAYMKANHPVEFLAASMAFDMNNTDKLNVFRQELDRLGIPLLIPDINASETSFSVESVRTAEGDEKDGIRYALAAVKNVGGAAMDALIAERRENGPFKSISDFANRLDPHNVNKRQLENLTRAGAFDRLEPNRRRVYKALETVVAVAAAATNDRNSDQMGFFGGEDAEPEEIRMPQIEDWAPMDRLREEFDAVGFYLSAHPLDAFERVLARKRVRNIAEVVAAQEVGAVRLAGTFISKKEMTSKTGKRFAFISFSDPSGVFEATAFSEILSDYSEMLVAGNSMIVDCTANFEGDMPRLTIQGLLSIDAAAAEAANAAREMHIFLDDLEPLGPLSDVLARGKADNGKKAKGRVLITARLRDQDEEVDIKLSEPFQLTHELSLAVRSLPGVLDVREL